MSREHELARWFVDRDEATAAPLRAEIERLRAALQRIDGINDNPAVYNPMIEEVLRAALKDRNDDMQAILESVKKQATEVRIGTASSQADQKLANALACLAEVVTALRPKP